MEVMPATTFPGQVTHPKSSFNSQEEDGVQTQPTRKHYKHVIRDHSQFWELQTKNLNKDPYLTDQCPKTQETISMTGKKFTSITVMVLAIKEPE